MCSSPRSRAGDGRVGAAGPVGAAPRRRARRALVVVVVLGGVAASLRSPHITAWGVKRQHRGANAYSTCGRAWRHQGTQTPGSRGRVSRPNARYTVQSADRGSSSRAVVPAPAPFRLLAVAALVVLVFALITQRGANLPPCFRCSRCSPRQRFVSCHPPIQIIGAMHSLRYGAVVIDTLYREVGCRCPPVTRGAVTVPRSAGSRPGDLPNIRVRRASARRAFAHDQAREVIGFIGPSGFREKHGDRRAAGAAETRQRPGAGRQPRHLRQPARVAAADRLACAVDIPDRRLRRRNVAFGIRCRRSTRAPCGGRCGRRSSSPS